MNVDALLFIAYVASRKELWIKVSSYSLEMIANGLSTLD